MDAEVLERLTEMGVSEEDLQDPEKVKELAEKFEAENKEVKTKEEEAENKDDKVLNDQMGRLAKAISKNKAFTENKSQSPQSETLSELDVDNRVFIQSQKLSSDQVAILENYSHLPTNKGKSFETIFSSSAVKAEMKILQSELDAKDELDTNADSDKLLETKNEIHEKYSKTGETPDNEYERKVVAEKALEEEGFREY